MIQSFRHAGIEKFFLTGSKADIQPKHAAWLAIQLFALNNARSARDMDVPAWKLHELKGNLAGHWSIWINGSWRLTFAFEGENAILVDYQDYH